MTATATATATSTGPTPPPIRVGVDVLRIGELDQLLTRPWFLRFVYADNELAYNRSVGAARGREFLAGRFAAKEAILKVLGTGLFRGVAPREIAIDRSADGAPTVRLDGSAARLAAGQALGYFALSIAHKHDIVTAVAIGYGASASVPSAELADSLARSSTAVICQEVSED